ADQGTLFLDKVGDIPLELQRDIADFIQEQRALIRQLEPAGLRRHDGSSEIQFRKTKHYYAAWKLSKHHGIALFFATTLAASAATTIVVIRDYPALYLKVTNL